MSLARKQLESWLKTLSIKADKVVDIGGVVFPVKTRVKTWDVEEYQILDIKPESRKAKTDIVYDLNDPSLHILDEADVMFCLEVMQFVYDPLTVLKNLSWNLKNGGILYITFPLVYPEMKGQDYLRYTELGARKLLSEAKFIVKDFQPTLSGYIIKAICQK